MAYGRTDAAEAAEVAELLGELHERRSLATLRRAVDRVGDVLERGGLGEAEVATVGEQLVVLAEHGDSFVRKLVAHALRFLQHESFHRALAPLLRDDDLLVREAAERTLSRRSDRSRAEALGAERGTLYLAGLDEIEARFGRRARDAAARLAARHTEYFVREVLHEVVRALTSLDSSLRYARKALAGNHTNHVAVADEHLARAADTATFLFAIIDSVKMLATEATPAVHPERLAAVVDEAVRLVANRARSAVDAAPPAITVMIDPALRLDAHRHRLVQALTNLLHNAVDACEAERPGAGLIEITAEVGPTHATLRITDNGCGMPEVAVADACEIFATNKPGGTGFGLPIAKKIIEQEHGGTLSLASRKHLGTTVTVALPLWQPRTERAP